MVADDFVLRPERLVITGASLASRRTRWVHDEYHDTADLRLARWGVTLRWRDGEGWTVKIPRPSRGPLVLDRDEVHVEGAHGPVPAEAVAFVAPFARGAALERVADIATDRTARVWQRPDGSTLGELVDDRVTGTTEAGTVGFRELEFELDADADPAVLTSVAEQLGIAGGGRAMPKLVRVLGDAAAEPPDVICPTLAKRPRAAEAIRAVIAGTVAELLTNVPAARAGTSTEGVHRTRVATRRLRSDLQTFEPLLDKKWATRLRRELRWLTSELGRVRDADVLDIRIGEMLESHPEIDPVGGAELRSHLARQRDRDLETLLVHLADTRAVELFDHLVDAARSPRTRKRARKRRAAAALPPLVRASWRALRTAVDDLGPSPTDAELHRIRILAKRVRYAADAVSPAVGKEARRFAKAAASIQDSLGDINDSAVAAAWLERSAASDLGPRGAAAAGLLAEQFRAHAAAERTDWRKAYEKMRRRSGWLARQ